MKRLLFVYDRMMMGGTTTALLSLLNEVNYNEYKVDLLLYKHEGICLDAIPPQVGLLPEAYKASKFKLLNSSRRKLLLSLLNGSLFHAIHAYRKYKGTIKGNIKTILAQYFLKSQVGISRTLGDNYDVAIGFIEGWSDHFVLSDKVKANKKIVWIHPDYQDSYLVPEVDRKSFVNADSIVMVSSKCRANFDAIFPEYANKSTVIENIISQSHIKQRAKETTPDLKKGSINLCTVCRCDAKVKGLDRVLNSLSRLKQENYLDSLVWHLIGDGPDYKMIQKRVIKVGLSDNVILYGNQMNPLPILSQMDAFLLASRFEGKPVSVAEALALGIPCIVTDYASAKEQVRDGIDGLVVENSEDGVYGAIIKVILKPEFLDVLKKNLSDNQSDNLTEMNKLYKLIGE